MDMLTVSKLDFSVFGDIPELQIFPARKIWERGIFPDTSIPLFLYGIESRESAELLKKWLLLHYGESVGARLFVPDGIAEICLKELDCREAYGKDVGLLIGAQPDFLKERYGFADLVRITARLTEPDGCPWDREQTHASIAKNAVEEANELSEAIANNDTDNILEESGDVLLQGVFHGDIARRAGEFTTEDIIDRLCKKLVSRHTHIFGGDKAATAEEALAFWNAAKKREK